MANETNGWAHHLTETSVGPLSWWEHPSTNTAPTLLALHGFSDDATCMMPFLTFAGLTERFRVIAPDAIGHGATPLGEREEQRGNIGHNVHALGELLDSLDVREVALLGHSMGALGASLFAEAFPHRTTLALLEDPVWRVHEDLSKDRRPIDGSEHPLIAWTKRMQRLSIANRKRLAHLENKTWLPDELDTWATSKDHVDERLFDGPVRWAPHGWQQTAAANRCPTLLITGEPSKGAIVTDEAAELALSLLLQGERVHIRGASHSIRRDAPEEMAKAIHEFLDRITATR